MRLVCSCMQSRQRDEESRLTCAARSTPEAGGSAALLREREDKRMTKQKRKLTPAEKAEKKRRRAMYETVFIGGKQKRVKREPTIDGLSIDEFVRRNTDPIWYYQNEMWERMDQREDAERSQLETARDSNKAGHFDDNLPF
jgi:hypothetical protein